MARRCCASIQRQDRAECGPGQPRNAARPALDGQSAERHVLMTDGRRGRLWPMASANWLGNSPVFCPGGRDRDTDAMARRRLPTSITACQPRSTATPVHKIADRLWPASSRQPRTRDPVPWSVLCRLRLVVSRLCQTTTRSFWWTKTSPARWRQSTNRGHFSKHGWLNQGSGDEPTA